MAIFVIGTKTVQLDTAVSEAFGVVLVPKVRTQFGAVAEVSCRMTEEAAAEKLRERGFEIGRDNFDFGDGQKNFMVATL